MRRYPILTLGLCTMILVVCHGSSPAQAKPVPEKVGLKAQSASHLKSATPQACTVMSISCGQTVNSILTANDCALEDGSLIDFWEFQGTDGQEVTIDMISNQFDTFLLLIDPTPETATIDDDSGEGTNSRIVYSLDATGTWSIGANALFAGDRGTYSLSLACGTTGPPPPAAPSDLTVTALSPTAVELDWQDNSDDENEFRIEQRALGGSFEDIGGILSGSTSSQVSGLSDANDYDFRVRARNSGGDSNYSNLATAFRGPCVASETVLCLNGDRFQVEVGWVKPDGVGGPGRDVGFGSADSGLFWFLNSANWEILVKVLDACAFSDRYWVFSAATTNLEYTLEVTDTQTGLIQEYFNPQGTNAAAVNDADAFATCP